MTADELHDLLRAFQVERGVNPEVIQFSRRDWADTMGWMSMELREYVREHGPSSIRLFGCRVTVHDGPTQAHLIETPPVTPVGGWATLPFPVEYQPLGPPPSPSGPYAVGSLVEIRREGGPVQALIVDRQAYLIVLRFRDGTTERFDIDELRTWGGIRPAGDAVNYPTNPPPALPMRLLQEHYALPMERDEDGRPYRSIQL